MGQTVSTATALDPADAMSAAINDAYDQLRQLVEKFAGRRDDPELLEEVGTVRRRALGRYNRARKKAEPPAEKPVPEPRAAEPAPAKPAAEVAPAAPKTVPAAAPPQSAERVTVKLTEPASPQQPIGEREMPAAPSTAEQPRGRHRQPRTPWGARRPQLLVVALVLLGAALIAATGNPLVVLGGGAVVSALVRVGAPQRLARRLFLGRTQAGAR